MFWLCVHNNMLYQVQRSTYDVTDKLKIVSLIQVCNKTEYKLIKKSELVTLGYKKYNQSLIF